MSLMLASLPFFILGLLAGRPATLLVPPAACGIFFGGLAAGWWGAGLGDGWPFALTGFSAVATVATATGIAVRRAYAHVRGPRAVTRDADERGYGAPS
jgi:hypothetical protein